MIAGNGGPERARWQVIWVSDGRIVKKDFGADLPEAIRIYGLAVKADKRLATLRCCNMAFSPPDKYADKEYVLKVKPNGKKVKVKRLTKPRRYFETMAKVNLKGVWWCPYCMAMRKFKVRKRSRIEGVVLQDPRMVCPTCGISHEDGNVKRYNPAASKVTAGGVPGMGRARRR